MFLFYSTKKSYFFSPTFPLAVFLTIVEEYICLILDWLANTQQPQEKFVLREQQLVFVGLLDMHQLMPIKIRYAYLFEKEILKSGVLFCHNY